MDELETRIVVCGQRWEAAPRSRAFIPLADALRQAGRWEESLAVLEAGLAWHPESVGGLVTLARTLASAGREALAAAAAARVLERDPDNVAALDLLSGVAEAAGDLAAAVARCERLVQLEPGDPHWADRLSLLRAKESGLPTGAEAEDAEAGFATLTLVDLCLAQGYHEKAARLLRRLAAEKPGDPLVAARLAALHAAPAENADRPGRLDRFDGPDAEEGPVLPARSAPFGIDRREAAREQFNRWLDRIRAERELPQ